MGPGSMIFAALRRLRACFIMDSLLTLVIFSSNLSIFLFIASTSIRLRFLCFLDITVTVRFIQCFFENPRFSTLASSLFSSTGTKGFKYKESVTSKSTDVDFSRPRLAILAFSKAETQIKLRLSIPIASKADCSLSGINFHFMQIAGLLGL